MSTIYKNYQTLLTEARTDIAKSAIDPQAGVEPPNKYQSKDMVSKLGVHQKNKEDADVASNEYEQKVNDLHDKIEAEVNSITGELPIYTIKQKVKAIVYKAVKDISGRELDLFYTRPILFNEETGEESKEFTTTNVPGFADVINAGGFDGVYFKLKARMSSYPIATVVLIPRENGSFEIKSVDLGLHSVLPRGLYKKAKLANNEHQKSLDKDARKFHKEVSKRPTRDHRVDPDDVIDPSTEELPDFEF